jgi:hypothetical protein
MHITSVSSAGLARLVLEVLIVVLAVWQLYRPVLDNIGHYSDHNIIYHTTKITFDDLWDSEKLSAKPPPIFNETLERKLFKDRFRCAEEVHPICACIDLSTQWSMLQNCLLQENIPNYITAKETVSMLAVVLFWFGVSCGSSWVAYGGLVKLTSSHEDVLFRNANILIYVGYIVIIASFVVVAYLFAQKSDSGTAFVLFWGWLLATLPVVWVLHKQQFRYTKMVATGSEGYDDAKNYVYTPSDKQAAETQFPERNTRTIKHSMFYSNLLIVAPAITIVLHLSHQWYDKDQIINSICLILGIIAIDGFSMHVTNRWEMEKMIFPAHINVQIGTIKMFAWMCNLLSIYLLFTINYPTVVDNPNLAYGLFSILVLYLSASFIVPDLVREFSHMHTDMSLDVRIYGEVILRIIAVFYILFQVKQTLIQNGLPRYV